jgi:hypothetical protein
MVLPVVSTVGPADYYLVSTGGIASSVRFRGNWEDAASNASVSVQTMLHVPANTSTITFKATLTSTGSMRFNGITGSSDLNRMELIWYRVGP